MALNPSIILAGQQPDIVNILATANQAAQQQKEFKRSNALADYTQANGAGILAGEQNALAGYAGFDPVTAMNIQNSQADNARADRQEARLTRQEEQMIQDRAAAMTAAERAAEAAQLEESVKMGLMIPDAATWDQQMAQMAPELVGQFGVRDALAAKYMSVAEILKMQTPDPMAALDLERAQLEVDALRNPQPGFRPATREEAAQYGAAGGQINQKTGEFKPITPPSGMAITTNPDGTMTLAQGPGVGGKPLTEGQSKDNVFKTRAEGALAQLEPVAGALASRGDRIAGMVPLGLGREVQSPDFQVAEQAGDEFLQAILRKDTGAAITPSEQALYGTTYLPQPGDGPAVLEAKRQSRARAVEALAAGMSMEQLTMTEQALVRAAARSEGKAQPATAPVAQPMSDDDLLNMYGG